MQVLGELSFSQLGYSDAGDCMSSVSTWFRHYAVYALSYTSIFYLRKEKAKFIEVKYTPSVSPLAKLKFKPWLNPKSVLYLLQTLPLYIMQKFLRVIFMLYSPQVGKQKPRKMKWIDLATILSYFTKLFLIKINIKGKQNRLLFKMSKCSDLAEIK